LQEETNLVLDSSSKCSNNSLQNQVLQEVMNQEKNKTLASRVPSPFKKVLFWPEEKQIKKRQGKEKIPSVVTSEQWKKYQYDKEEKKRLQEEEKENRKKIRLEKLRIKKEKSEEMKKLKLIKKKKK